MKRPTTREPSGRPQREREFAPAVIRRLRDQAMRGLRDPEWGSELGRLWLSQKIDDSQYAAGRRWRYDAANYWLAIDVFPIHTAALELGQATEPDPDSAEGQKRAAHDREAVEKFFAAHAALLASSPTATAAVRRLCEDDLSLAGVAELDSARRGLSALARHYGLTEQGKSGQMANR